MSAPLYSIEEGVERATISALTGITALAGLTFVRADLSAETPLPLVYVRAETEEALASQPNVAGTWIMQLSVALTCPADDSEDATADGGADALQAYWKALTDTLTADAFRTNANAAATCFLWGVEWQGATYDQAERNFTRTARARIWANSAYDS
jgi:outer membrane protein W